MSGFVGESVWRKGGGEGGGGFGKLEGEVEEGGQKHRSLCSYDMIANNKYEHQQHSNKQQTTTKTDHSTLVLKRKTKGKRR